MRLLKNLMGQSLEFTKDLDEDDMPPYAILSHTWGADEEEVTYADIMDGTGKHKNGYNKLAFCAERARRDGQTYIWVDTGCIDKSNSIELNTAIPSMYQWYAKATKCYVYLPDVLGTPSRTDSDYSATQHADLRRCRWLTRGWTLQELLAPKVVKFYDKAGEKIGDKMTLERHICDITGIPGAALRGRSLSSFSIEERFSWQMSRRTKRPEDEVYALSGICSRLPFTPQQASISLRCLDNMLEAIVSAGPKVEVATAGPDQVLVRVAVAGTNPKDLLIPDLMGKTLNTGDDGAGIVKTVWDNVTASARATE
ncbi:hypothetical protein LTR86_010824 [Recurvomyces mirabilis]|nr:hypothetical protein LTR86_010824 [Recurvomyces mirabilis]